MQISQKLPETEPALRASQRPAQLTRPCARRRLRRLGEGLAEATEARRLSTLESLADALVSRPMQCCRKGSWHHRLGSGGEDGAGGRHAPPQRCDCRRRQAGALANVQVGQTTQRCQLEQRLIVQLHAAFQLQPPQACRVHWTPVRCAIGFIEKAPEIVLILELCSRTPQTFSRAPRDASRLPGTAWQVEPESPLIC